MAQTSINSMTGYARASGESVIGESATGESANETSGDLSWVWEVRAVNGKSLDMRLRLPNGFERLDPLVRKTVSKKLKRGNLQISLSVNMGRSSSAMQVDHEWLDVLMREGDEITGRYGLAPATIDGLYRVSGVLVDQGSGMDEAEFEKQQSQILKSLDDMLDALITARAKEGSALKAILIDCVEGIAGLNEQAKTCAATQSQAIKKRFESRISELVSDDLPQDKLLHEVAILVQKADIREEVDRLDAHIEQAHELIAKGSPIGRKLDFLSQEFIREINTLCSKSSDIDLTRVGLEMKTLLEQFREQAANVE